MTISSGMPMRSRAMSSNAVGFDIAGFRQRMEIEIDDGRGDIFDRGKSHVEITRGNKPLQQFLRHRFAGLVVARKAPQHAGLFAASVRKAATAARRNRSRRGAGDFRIGDGREQAVQRMAEFVEQGARVVEAEQRRLAVGGLGEIADIDDVRRDVAGELLLIAQRRHPGAAALGRPRRNSRRRTGRSARRRGRAPPRPARRDARPAHRCAGRS